MSATTPDPQLTDEAANPQIDEAADPQFDETDTATMATNIKLGDALNLAGATAVGNFAPAAPFAAGYNGRVSQPIDLRKNAMAAWQQGLYSGAFATYTAANAGNFNSGEYQQLCWIGGLACAFPNADANEDLGLGSALVSATGGTVRLSVFTDLTAAEKSAIAKTAALATGFPAAVNCLSGAINTGPYVLGAPRAYSCRVTLPADYGNGGRWLGVWELPVPQGDPPELDNLEAVVINGALAFTSTVHDASISGGSSTVVWPLPAGLTPTSPIAVTRVTYPDVTAVYAGATLTTSKCVAKWATPPDVASRLFQYIIDYGIGAPGSWGGGLPAGQSPGPVTVDQIQALIMPPAYPGPGSATPTPTPTPTPVPTPSPGQAAFTALEAAMAKLKAVMGWT